MNLNSIIALLEIKGIVSRDEGEKLVEYLNNKPQSTVLSDAVEQLKELVADTKPVLEQVKSETDAVIDAVAEDIKKVTDKPAKK